MCPKDDKRKMTNEIRLLFYLFKLPIRKCVKDILLMTLVVLINKIETIYVLYRRFILFWIWLNGRTNLLEMAYIIMPLRYKCTWRNVFQSIFYIYIWSTVSQILNLIRGEVYAVRRLTDAFFLVQWPIRLKPSRYKFENELKLTF